jgi:hypothetical protein
MYRRGRSSHWVKVKNPNAPAVTREAKRDLASASSPVATLARFWLHSRDKRAQSPWQSSGPLIDFAEFPPNLLHREATIGRGGLMPGSHGGTERAVPHVANDGTESSFPDDSSQGA